MEKSNKMKPVKWIFMLEKLIKNIELRFVFFTSHRMLDQRDHRVHRGEVVVVVDHAESGVVGGVPDPHRQGQYGRGEGIREDTYPLVMMPKSLWRTEGGTYR